MKREKVPLLLKKSYPTKLYRQYNPKKMKAVLLDKRVHSKRRLLQGQFQAVISEFQISKMLKFKEEYYQNAQKNHFTPIKDLSL